MKSPDDIVVRDNSEDGRFEAQLDGELAIAEYRRAGDILFLTHTEVPESMEGKGIGSTLVRGALDHARERGYQVAPICPFVAAWIRRHAAYADLVHPRFRHMVAR